VRGKPAKELNGAEARAVAYRFLGRREYSQFELSQKLQQRGVSQSIADELTQNLVEEGLVSDQRFAEVFCRSRISRLVGPVKIRAELKARGVEDSIIASHLSVHDEEWIELALEWTRKRFRGQMEQREKARLYRGGRNRGFSHDHIMRAIDRLQKSPDKDG
jgi:regulatory protein